MARESLITVDDDWFTGEDKTINLIIYTDDTGTTPKNISGYTLLAELRKFRDSPSFVAQWPITLDTPVSGTCHFTVASAETNLYEPGTYYLQAVRTNLGSRTIESFGTAVLKRGVRV